MNYKKHEIILRFGALGCFVGHGVLALKGKPEFLNLLLQFDLSTAVATKVLFLIGVFDIITGIIVFLKPSKPMLIYASIWTSITVIAWAFHGDSIFDLLRRTTYITTPLALFYFYKFHHATTNTPILVSENQMSIEGNPDLDSTTKDVKQNISTSVNDIDLRMVKNKLQDSEEGVDWTEQQCNEVEKEYKRFLHLKRIYKNEKIVPNYAIDTMWHHHILDSRAYFNDCQKIFGEYLHHFPYFGMRGLDDKIQLELAFKTTMQLYKNTFGESMNRPEYLPSFNDNENTSLI